MKYSRLKKYMLLIIYFPLVILAESQFTISGKIKDYSDKQPISDVNLKFINTNYGTSTDLNGNFKIKVKSGKYILSISHIGYKSHSLAIHCISDTLLNTIYLYPTIIEMPNISVIDKNETNKDFTYNLSQQQLLNHINPLPDPLLSIKTLPGVYSTNDQTTSYSVRGGSYDENLIYVNGIEIFQPLLVRKGIMENPSVVNASLVENINLRTSSFPVNYGDKLSSALDIQYLNTIANKISGKFSLSTINSDLTLKIPISEKSSGYMGIRKVNYGYLFNALPTTKGNYSPDFNDIQVGFTFSPNSRNKINILGIYAKSLYQLDPQNMGPYIDPVTFETKYEYYLTGREAFNYKHQIFGIQWESQMTNNMFLSSIFSYMKQNEKENTNVEYYQMDSDIIIPTEPANWIRSELYHNSLNQIYYRYKTELKIKFIGKYYTYLGLELKKYEFDDNLFESVNDEALNTGEYSSLNLNRKYNCIGKAVYLNQQWIPHLAHKLTFGLRVIQYSMNDELLYLPRLAYQLNCSNNLKFELTLGKYAQPPLYKEYHNFNPNEISNLLAQKSFSTNLSIHYRNNIGNQLIFNCYYKELTDIISYDLWDVRMVYSGMNDAIGYIYGFDLNYHLIFKEYAKGFVSYNYLVAKEDLITDNEGWVPRPSDQRHTIGAMLEDRMKEYKGSKIFIRFVYNSGTRYTSFFIQTDDQGNQHIISGKRNSLKVRSYSRFDVGLSQEKQITNNLKIKFTQEVLNLFNHYNILGYTRIDNNWLTHELSGRTFNIGMELLYN